MNHSFLRRPVAATKPTPIAASVPNTPIEGSPLESSSDESEDELFPVPELLGGHPV